MIKPQAKGVQGAEKHRGVLARHLLEDIGGALHHLQKHKIVHWDLHPVNVQVTPDLGFVLLDFGRAQIVGDLPPVEEGQPFKAHSLEACLPPRYPEVPYRTPGDYYAQDNYALGMLLHLILKLKYPHGALDDSETLPSMPERCTLQTAADEWPALIPPSLAAPLRGLLHPDRAERWDMAQLLVYLQSTVSRSPSS